MVLVFDFKMTEQPPMFKLACKISCVYFFFLKLIKWCQILKSVKFIEWTATIDHRWELRNVDEAIWLCPMFIWLAANWDKFHYTYSIFHIDWNVWFLRLNKSITFYFYLHVNFASYYVGWENNTGGWRLADHTQDKPDRPIHEHYVNFITLKNSGEQNLHQSFVSIWSDFFLKDNWVFTNILYETTMNRRNDRRIK